MLPARCCSPPAPARAQVKKFADSRNRVPCLGLAVAASTSPTGKPNLVFMLQDDLGFNDVGFTSGTPSTEPAATANITALARSGIVLRQHYVHWHCSPSRRSFLTGRLPIHHGELLSDIDTDDIDLRWSWISDKRRARAASSYSANRVPSDVSEGPPPRAALRASHAPHAPFARLESPPIRAARARVSVQQARARRFSLFVR